MRGEGYEVVVEHACEWWWRWVPCQMQARAAGLHSCASCVKGTTNEDSHIHADATTLLLQIAAGQLAQVAPVKFPQLTNVKEAMQLARRQTRLWKI